MPYRVLREIALTMMDSMSVPRSPSRSTAMVSSASASPPVSVHVVQTIRSSSLSASQIFLFPGSAMIRLATSSHASVRSSLAHWDTVRARHGWARIYATDDLSRGGKLATFVLYMIHETSTVNVYYYSDVPHIHILISNFAHLWYSGLGNIKYWYYIYNIIRIIHNTAASDGGILV